MGGNSGLLLHDNYHGDIYFCYNTSSGLIPLLYSCKNCIDREGVPDALDATCSESPISTCKIYSVDGEFRIGVYDWPQTRPDVIYGKGACPKLVTTISSSTTTIGSSASTTGSISTTGSTIIGSISTSITTSVVSTIGSEVTSTGQEASTSSVSTTAIASSGWEYTTTGGLGMICNIDGVFTGENIM